MNAIDYVLLRLVGEEGQRLAAYDDATGKTVRAPVGHLSWGWGFNLEAIGSPGLFSCMATYILTGLDKQLDAYPFYKLADPVRQSVFLDIAYNEGVGGLLHFPHMIAYAQAGNWELAAGECRIADPHVDQQRYAPLREILRTGGI